MGAGRLAAAELAAADRREAVEQVVGMAGPEAVVVRVVEAVSHMIQAISLRPRTVRTIRADCKVYVRDRKTIHELTVHENA